MSPADRARAAHKAAEVAREAGDLRTASALKSAAAAWERVAGPGLAWGTRRLKADLLKLRIDCAIYRGPFAPPQPPKAPSPVAAIPVRETVTRVSTPVADPVTIQF